MISLFGYALSALTPWAFAAIAPALALLVYVYRKKGDTRSTVVSALFLFERLPRVLPSRRRFVPPFQFWLELLVFVLLVAAAATLVANRSGKHIAIAIDSSLSMAARDPSGVPRIESAKSAALGDLATTTASDRFSVFSLGAGLSRVSEPAVGVPGVREALEKISPIYSNDRAATLAASLLGDAAYDEVWIYTDRQPAGGSASNESLRFITVSTAEMTKGLTNAWIGDLSHIETDGRSSINVLVELSGSTGAEALVTARCREEGGAQLAPVSVDVYLPPSTPTSVTVSIPSSAWTECAVVIGLEGGLADPLALDDRGFLVRSSRGESVALVSPLTVEQLGLGSVSHTKFTQGIRRNANAIYHRAIPSETPDAAALVVYPPAGALPWGGSVRESSLEEGRVTRSLESHPLTLYVNTGLLSLPKPRILDCPDSSAPIMHTSEGPVACAGERDGNRYLVLGFEIFPFDGARNPSTSILTLNALKWLFQGVNSAGGSRTFVPINVPPNTESARYMEPLSLELPVSSSQSITPPAPGIIQFMGSGGTRAGAAAVNFFSPQESNLSFDTPVELPVVQPPARTSRERAIPLFIWLAIAALAVLTIDIARQLRAQFERRQR